MLRPRCSPGVIELETLVAEISSAVSAAFSGLQSLWRFTKLTHHCDTAQTHRVSVPGDDHHKKRKVSAESKVKCLKGVGV